MASSPKLISILLSLLFIQIHARESNFFSKVPNNGRNFDTKETQIPNKVDPLTNPEKTTSSPLAQEPNFIPQTQDNNYGLYGHESGQLPPNSDEKFSGGRPFTTTTTTTTYNDDNKYRRNDALSYKSESEEYYNYDNNYNSNNNFQNSNTKPYENSFYYNKDLYDNGRQNFHNTRLSRNDYTTTPLYDQEKYEHDDNSNFYYNNNNNNGGDNNNANNVVRQGMSDTRFMENGKYYYDLDKEPHHYSRSRGHFGNNNNNNGNTYEYGNSMGRYQNQNDEAEFQEEPDEFVP